MLLKNFDLKNEPCMYAKKLKAKGWSVVRIMLNNRDPSPCALRPAPFFYAISLPIVR
jgi:hypothetical protein